MPTPTDPNMAQAWISGTPPDQTIDFYIPRGNTGPVGPVGPVGPSLAVGAILTTSGPAAPGTVGPTGLTGAKGDPGGFATGTLLGTNNLNSITVPGLYRTTSGTNTTLANNYPVNNNGGILTVTEMSTGYVVQTYESLNGTAQSGSVVYKRQLANAVWTVWRAYASMRVDQTAGRAIYQWDDVNSRDQLIYGDTGWRTIVSWDTAGVVTGTMPTGFSPQAGKAGGIDFRRIGSLVHCNIRAAITNTTSQQILIPAGFSAFAAPWPSSICAYVNASGVESFAIIKAGASSIFLSIPNAALLSGNDATYGSTFLYPTLATWPTVLPGVAFGSIPYA